MKNLLLVFLLQIIGSLSSFTQQNHFNLTGSTYQIPDSAQLFLVDGATNERIDSTWIINNQFYFKGEATPYKEAYLFLEYNGKFEFCSLFLENQNMQFDASRVAFRNATIRGSLLQDQATELHQQTQYWYDQLTLIEEQLSAHQKHPKRDSLTKIRAQCFDEIHAITKTFIQAHPDYLVSVRSLTFLKHYLPKAEIQVLYEGLTKEMKETAYGQSTKIWLEQSKELAIGDIAPDFQLPNLNNEEIILSKVTSIYTLLEFGASGCGPCRKENPILLAAYQQYQDQGFEIVSVWLDKSKKHWEQTVQKDQMIWKTVSDLKGHNGKVPLLYNVNGIPTNYLLDQNRRVIAKNVRGEQLQEELAKLFDKQ